MKEKIYKYLNKQKKNMLDDLKKVVDINSGSGNIEGVNSVGNFFYNEFSKIGLHTRKVKGKNYGTQLIFSNRHRKKNTNLLLLGHLDTVFPVSHHFQKMTIYRKKGISTGPGVNDMKGGLIVVLYAVKFLKFTGNLNNVNLTILFSTDEEAGSPETKKTIKNILSNKKIDCCLCFEVSGLNNEIVTKRFGIGRYYMTVKGIAAHACSRPGKGVSAIEELSHKIIKLQALNNYSKGILVNVGLVEGGIKPNIVPPKAEAVIDARVKHLKYVDRVNKKIRKIADCKILNGTETIIKGEIHRPPMIKLPGAVPYIRKVKKIGGILDIKISEEMRAGGSDASIVTTLGVPAMDGFGPIGDKDHSDKEYIINDSMVHRTALTILSLLKL